MNDQACRACGSKSAVFLFQSGSNRVVRCRECTHVFLDIVHTPETIRQMYEGYEDAGRNFYFENLDDEVNRHFDRYLWQCRQHRTETSEMRLLDIGCGNGSFLSRAKKQGFLCEGIETCIPLAEETRKKLECPVHTALLSECDFPDETFDVVTMYDLIEHLQNPIEDLRQVHRWLKPGGVLFLLTPNDRALLRRVARLAFRGSFHLIRRPTETLYYEHHLSYFTPASLKILLQRTGLEVAHMETQNQEISRLNISGMERLAVGAIFWLSGSLPWSGGKLLAWSVRK